MGTTAAASFDHKAGVTNVISNYTLVGTGTVLRYANNLTGYTWNDGTPTPSTTNTTTGLYVSGTGNGFRFTVPGDTTSRTLTVYVGGYNSDATLTAHLSDGLSAPTSYEGATLAYFASGWTRSGPNSIFRLKRNNTIAQTLHNPQVSKVELQHNGYPEANGPSETSAKSFLCKVIPAGRVLCKGSLLG